MTRAVVFAYHDVGVRCLEVLRSHGIELSLVVTHEDDPRENRWFASVRDWARDRDVPWTTPERPNTAELVARVRELAADFLFSFYYRRMLGEALLGLPARGALNMHGSLLPHYRGRAPVNWAVLHGETRTGASLHYMTARPDAGDLVDQQAVPILADDTAGVVFNKVTWAAEVVLDRSLPALVAGAAPRTPLDLAAGSYFGGRRPEDGRIDWSRGAAAVHNLVRAVAPPYPGAFGTVEGRPLRLLETRRAGAARHPDRGPCLYGEAGRIYADCADGRRLRVLHMEIDGETVTVDAFRRRYGDRILALGA